MLSRMEFFFLISMKYKWFTLIVTGTSTLSAILVPKLV